MNWSQTINTLIFVIGTFISVYQAIHIAREKAQKLPEHQANRLEQFARMVVQEIEQVYTNNPGKKALAEAHVAELFKMFNLPIPPKEAISIAIEAAVLLLPKKQGE